MSEIDGIHFYEKSNDVDPNSARHVKEIIAAYMHELGLSYSYPSVKLLLRKNFEENVISGNIAGYITLSSIISGIPEIGVYGISETPLVELLEQDIAHELGHLKFYEQMDPIYWHEFEEKKLAKKMATVISKSPIPLASKGKIMQTSMTCYLDYMAQQNAFNLAPYGFYADAIIDLKLTSEMPKMHRELEKNAGSLDIKKLLRERYPVTVFEPDFEILLARCVSPAFKYQTLIQHQKMFVQEQMDGIKNAWNNLFNNQPDDYVGKVEEVRKFTLELKDILERMPTIFENPIRATRVLLPIYEKLKEAYFAGDAKEELAKYAKDPEIRKILSGLKKSLIKEENTLSQEI